MSSLYDQVVYPPMAFPQTHPNRLATIGILFGMDPAPVARCRVLELACGCGANLIPMAAEFPGSEFLGIDSAATAIQTGREEICALGLTNIRLECMDVMDAGPELGRFDYVIAHGLYSWVPEPVRDRILAVSQDCLTPQGIGYVSYNALPGCRIRQVLREMMRFHLRGADGADARLKGALECLAMFAASQPAIGPNRDFLVNEAESLARKPAPVLFHDELSDTYHPVYLQEFVAHAARFGLQFLSESDIRSMDFREIPTEVAREVDRASANDRVVRDQYLDFLKFRPFRETLICRADVVLADAPLAESVQRLSAASPIQALSNAVDFASGVVEKFQGASGSVETGYPLSKAVMSLLGGAWPAALPFSGLLTSAGRLLGEQPDPERLTQILLDTHKAGVTELHIAPPRCVSRPGRFPEVSAMARSQVRRGKLVTNPRHMIVEMQDDMARRLIALLDGTRDIADLARELGPLLNQSEEITARAIEINLGKLAKIGLLVA